MSGAVNGISEKGQDKITEHADSCFEQCFFAIRMRSNQKLITSEGILSHVFQAQYKSHIGKEMYIAMTSFRLNHNDITQRGQAYPLSLVRVGTMIKATKDSFKRVYKKTGVSIIQQFFRIESG